MRSIAADDDGVRRRQTAIHSDGLAIDIGRGVGRQKQRCLRNLIGNSGPSQGIELSDFTFAAAGARLFEYRTSHSGFNQARANGVDAYTRAGELVGCSLHETDHAGLAGAVGHAAGTGP